ncbi:glutaredoxin 2 [Pseudoalteromonas sp. B28]
MKLYTYSHCPFCARVSYIAGKLNIKLEEVIIDYDDIETPTNLIGKKMVPILEKDDDSIMAESNDIIRYFLQQKNVDELMEPSKNSLQWQSSAFLPLQQIGYPRWPLLSLSEFKTESSRVAWENKKQTIDLNFVQLLASTSDIVSQVNAFLIGSEKLLNIEDGKSHISLFDSAIYFSILRGLYCEPTITWPQQLNVWMNNEALDSGVPLLK